MIYKYYFFRAKVLVARARRSLPSKQKLKLKSIKTRFLPSRSGVLIEFQSRVFTGNSRAISGLKLEFHQVDIWMIFG